jgi:hypothetical protein
MRPLSEYGKSYTPPAGVVNPAIPSAPGPSAQANALSGEHFFMKAAEWFNKVPSPDADKTAGVEKVLPEFGIVYGKPFAYGALSLEKKLALTIVTKAIQKEFEKISANPASIGVLKNGWLIPNAKLGDFGTDYHLRAGVAYIGFGANLPIDGYYPLLLHDSAGKLLNGEKKYKFTFAKGELPPAGAFWSVTNYQDHFLVPNGGEKYAVSSWMNPKTNSDGSLTIYMQPTSPGANLETNWLPHFWEHPWNDSDGTPLLAIAGCSGWYMGTAPPWSR